jgi:tRNA(adenine34) deaminase
LLEFSAKIRKLSVGEGFCIYIAQGGNCGVKVTFSSYFYLLLLSYYFYLLYMSQADKDERFMRAALAEAEKALIRQEVPVGAVVVCKDVIIARAHNLTETLKDPTAHAEMQAITAAANYLGGKYLTGCSIYITVEPCMMCAAALGWSQVTSIVYGCSDEKKGYSLNPLPLLHRSTKVKKGILEEACRNLMVSFFKAKRNKKS